MKTRRSDRLVDMTNYFITHPHQLIPLTFFSERYESAKSSISEDLSIIKRTFEQREIGRIETISGAAGGVQFIPMTSEHAAKEVIEQLCERVSSENRLLPGGYVYLSDILGDPEILDKVGRVIATKFADARVDAIMTVATKGIPLAQATARHLNVPFVIVRRYSKITEGATVSVNYASGSSERIEKMELSKRSLKRHSRILVVDDFMKGGGTMNGIKDMIAEFDSELVDIVVLAESNFKGERAIDDYVSLLKVEAIDVANKKITVVPGNYFDK